MTLAQTDGSIQRKSLRLWPGVAIAALLVLFRFGVPIVAPDAMMLAMLGGLISGLAIVVWWAFFSRAPGLERWGAVLLMAVAMYVASRLLHVSMATAGMGMLFPIYAFPFLSLAFVVWAVASRGLADGPRRATMAATILLASGAWTLVRTGGISNGGDMDFAWRWTMTAEERLLAESDDALTARPATPVEAEAGSDWPGFRGPVRNGVAPGARIATDWAASPPVELWRRSVGPGWSSFAVRGDLFYTQEQRGEEEVVSCYHAATGEPVWRHSDAIRFWEANAGAGPRATPTLSEGRVYAFGATGVLNALDAGDGSLAWSRNAAEDTGVDVPHWGFASSPIAIDDVIVVATAGQLVAYDRATGDLRWSGPNGGSGYSSPHLLNLDGVPQVLLMSKAGAVSLAPADGALLWEHPWPGGVRIVQPALTADGDLLISRGGTTGIRRLAVVHSPDGWTTEERWTSNRLKPYFSDFVVHKGHAYGIDGNILACIDVNDGERKWKGGRYGSGQLVLLVDQDLLLVVSERGELALASAKPDQFTELARFPAVKGKTWNHPVLVGDLLLVRNSQEMVAFRLAPAGG